MVNYRLDAAMTDKDKASKLSGFTRGSRLREYHIVAVHTCAQLSHETSGANRIVLCNEVTDLLKIVRGQWRD
jgi:hypothetical protein